MYFNIVAQLYLQQENSLAAISAMQVLALTTKAYRVQSRASIPKHAISNVSINTDFSSYEHLLTRYENQSIIVCHLLLSLSIP